MAVPSVASIAGVIFRQERRDAAAAPQAKASVFGSKAAEAKGKAVSLSLT